MGAGGRLRPCRKGSRARSSANAASRGNSPESRGTSRIRRTRIARATRSHPHPGGRYPPAQPRTRPRGPRRRHEAGASGLTPRPGRGRPRRRAQDAQGRSGPFASDRTRSRAAGGSPRGASTPTPLHGPPREATRARSPPHRARHRSTTSARSRPASPARHDTVDARTDLSAGSARMGPVSI